MDAKLLRTLSWIFTLNITIMKTIICDIVFTCNNNNYYYYPIRTFANRTSHDKQREMILDFTDSFDKLIELHTLERELNIYVGD